MRAMTTRIGRRMPGHDYSRGAYFVTMTLRNRARLFGRIEHGEMILSDAGKMIVAHFDALDRRFRDVSVDVSQVMPDHVHVHIWMRPGDLTDGELIAGSLSVAIKWFKGATTQAYIQGVRTRGWPPFDGKLWDRGFYDLIIWSRRMLNTIRLYIAANPIKWWSKAGRWIGQRAR